MILGVLLRAVRPAHRMLERERYVLGFQEATQFDIYLKRAT